MAPRANILVVDDDESIRVGCAQVLTGEGYRVRTAGDGEAAMALWERESFDLVLLDLKMPGLSGMEVLDRLLASDPQVLVIIITGFATIDSAVRAIRAGAHDYVAKPFEAAHLLESVRKALRGRAPALQASSLAVEGGDDELEETIIGRSQPLRHVLARARRVAPTESTVLITLSLIHI